MSDGEEFKRKLYLSHLAQGFPEDLAKEVSELSTAITNTVLSIFVDAQKHASCEEVTIAATLCSAQVIINKLEALLGVTDLIENGNMVDITGSIH